MADAGERWSALLESVLGQALVGDALRMASGGFAAPPADAWAACWAPGLAAYVRTGANSKINFWCSNSQPLALKLATVAI